MSVIRLDELLKKSAKQKIKDNFSISKEKIETFSGFGIYNYNSKCIYRGNWKNGKREGMGKMRYGCECKECILFFYNYDDCNGKYIGHWKDDMREGIGIMEYGDGSIYKGYWNKDKRYGYGILESKDGSIYDGSFSNDMKNGYGIMEYNNLLRYEGDWKNDFRHGYGVVFDASDNLFKKGFWYNDHFDDSVYTRTRTKINKIDSYV